MAVDALQITTPTVHMDPEDAVAVNFWTVLWAGDSDAPDPAVASAQGVTATARAELVSVTWDMGEPAAAPWRDSGTPSIGGEQEQRWPEGCALDQGSATVRFTCQSAGSPASGATLLAGEQPLYPAYGFMYRWISKPDRTGGSGTWSVTATTTWRVTWSTDSGYVGAPLIRSFQSATFQVSVGEFRTAGGGG